MKIIDGEAVVYDPGAHEVLYLDAEALDFWKRIDGQRSEASLMDSLALAWGEPREDVARRFAAVLTAMQRHGWIRRGAGTTWRR